MHIDKEDIYFDELLYKSKNNTSFGNEVGINLSELSPTFGETNEGKKVFKSSVKLLIDSKYFMLEIKANCTISFSLDSDDDHLLLENLETDKIKELCIECMEIFRTKLNNRINEFLSSTKYKPKKEIEFWRVSKKVSLNEINLEEVKN